MEDKELLLKDLCARLPYGVKGTVEIEVSTGEYSIESGHLLFMEKEIDVELLGINKETEEIEVYPLNKNIDLSDYDYVINDFIPYLRPLSSMTEEEKEEFHKLKQFSVTVVMPNGVSRIKPTYIVDLEDDGDGINYLYDWLNAHHFDYRGLIEKGLAIEVTKENNPYDK